MVLFNNIVDILALTKQNTSSLQKLPEKWNEVKKLALKVRQDVAPMQSAEVMVLRRRCIDMEVTTITCLNLGLYLKKII